MWLCSGVNKEVVVVKWCWQGGCGCVVVLRKVVVV